MPTGINSTAKSGVSCQPTHSTFRQKNTKNYRIHRLLCHTISPSSFSLRRLRKSTDRSISGTRRGITYLNYQSFTSTRVKTFAVATVLKYSEHIMGAAASVSAESELSTFKEMRTKFEVSPSIKYFLLLQGFQRRLKTRMHMTYVYVCMCCVGRLSLARRARHEKNQTCRKHHVQIYYPYYCSL